MHWSNMEDQFFKQRYQKYKLRVKLWEKDFKKKNGRVPSKYDIREATQEIRDSYKMYYKLKTSFLEDTLNDVLSDDGFDVLEMSQLSQRDNGDINISFNGSLNGLSELPLDDCDIAAESELNQNSELSVASGVTKNALTLPLDTKQFLSNFEPEVELSLNKNAWGEKVSKKSIEKKEVADRTSKNNFNQKIFSNTSFSKRNPRKSLSRPALNSSLVGNGSSSAVISNGTSEALPDLETILLQKSKEQQSSMPVFVNSSLVAEVKTKVDEGWLNRNAGQNCLSSNNQPKSTASQKVAYGLSNIDISKLQETVLDKENSKALETSTQIANENIQLDCLESRNKIGINKESDSDSVVGNSEDEKESKEYRHIAKRRKIGPINEADNKSIISSLNDVKINSQYNAETNDSANKKHNVKKAKRNAKGKNDLAITKLKMKRNTQSASPKTRNSKKKALNMPAEQEMEEKPQNPDDLKYSLVLEQGELTSVPRVKPSDLKKADSLAKEYVNNVLPLTGAQPSTLKILTPAEEKRAAEKRKLEAKIASGKLNENFVTINIQKKTFVRGKKTINYSKYKKKLWKDKKRITALTGPNMDMRGCDGGTLKCFTCGQAGHFAQNCKVKGDSLLPLSAQLEDPSPFPTLEEAEQMASQLALAAHSRNIDKLPQATNAALYQSDHKTDPKDQLNDLEDDISLCSDEYELDAENIQTFESDEDLKEFDVDAASVGVLTNNSSSKEYVGHKIPESFLRAAGLDNSDMASNSISSKFGGVGPLYNLNADGSVREVTSDVLEVLKMFGHTCFRKGQDRAVMRILSGMSTLVTLSTGSGKSLCYQLPAYMYSRQCKAITLVISPLVSLMEDQVTGVPHFLRAHCLHTNQTPQQRVKIMQMISDGEIDVLLVSPEAVVSGERSTGFGSILKQLPPIAFACIDEAHCVSQWSHNFRPSYLMICKVLRKNLGVKCVLGLTATATLPTRLSIIKHLGITDGENGIISDIPLPDNLILSVSKDENKDASLLQLLLSKRFENCQSIIIYCTRRDECERVAGFLRTCLQDRKAAEPENVKKKRKRVNWHAEPYHAGMHASRRRTIQNAFMNNELRIVVATIAFGMGINKPDIRAVIHYNMPSNFESYVQEVGRAGRDSKISHCHLFLDANGGDKFELKRHIYANSLDRHVIRKLLQKIFVSCSCVKNVKDGVLLNPENAKGLNTNLKSEDREHVCPGHEIGFSVEKTVEALDIPAENIATLLCYMELDNRWNMNVLSNAYIMAKVISYGGPKYLKYAAKECPPLAMAIAVEIKNGTFKETDNVIEFSVIDIAAAIGWNSGVVKYQLKNLEWVQVNGYPKRSPVTVSFYDLGFRIKAPGDFTVEEIDEALDTLYCRSCEQEKKQLIQLQYVFQGLSSVAYKSHVPCCSETFSNDRSDQLKAIIRDYFHNDYPKNMELENEESNVSDADIEEDVLSLVSMYPENNFTGRNIARIFHGISSPNFPAVMWYRCKYWRAQSKTDFNRIVKLANNVIVRRRI